MLVRFRCVSHAILICSLFTAIFAPVSADLQVIPGHVDIGFETTATLEQLHHPLSSYAIMVFDLEKHLYASLDGEPDEINCDVCGANNPDCKKLFDVTDFTLNELKLTAPNIPTSPALTAVVTLGYRTNQTDATVPLISSGSISLTQLKNGSFTYSKTANFNAFSGFIRSDILMSKECAKNRQFSKVFFVIQIQFSGQGNLADYGLGSIDVHMRLEASVTTNLKIM